MDRWAELVQDDSYTFDRVLPFFQRTTAFTPPDNAERPLNASAGYNPAAFAEGGPLQVSYPVDSVAFSSWMERAMHDIGFGETQDFNSGTLLGAQYCSLTIHPSERTRCSSETAFGQIDDSIFKTKLYAKTMAKKVLFNSNKEEFTSLLERCLVLGHHPQPWKATRWFMLRKPNKKDPAAPRSYRPITLEECFGKVLLSWKDEMNTNGPPKARNR